MIFADKLIQLRKKSGWSQEELAQKMNVTRQSVSKWEMAQSIPDIEKIIRLSNLFNVSTDYLLKDEIEETELLNVADDDIPSIRRVSMKEANDFLSVKAMTSKPIALAISLCIISPITLLILSVMSNITKYNISENFASGIGIITIFILVAISVVVFILNGSKTSEFAYLEKEIFETEYGVSGMVKKHKEEYKSIYTRNTIIGVCLCILSIVPLFLGIILDENNDLLIIIMLSILLVFVSVGVYFLVSSGIIWSSFEKLLQENDYSKDKKKKNSARPSIYWLIVGAVYMIYSFITNNWGCWIILVVAGLLYPVVLLIVDMFIKKK